MDLADGCLWCKSVVIKSVVVTGYIWQASASIATSVEDAIASFLGRDKILSFYFKFIATLAFPTCRTFFAI